MPRSSIAPSDYSLAQKRLHWAVVGLVLLQYLALDGIGRLFNQGLESGAMPYTLVTGGHIAAGTLVLVLAMWRVALRVRIGAPRLPEEEPSPRRRRTSRSTRCCSSERPRRLVPGLRAPGRAPCCGVHGPVVAGGRARACRGLHQVWWKTEILRRMT
jgi:cytochrome b561